MIVDPGDQYYYGPLQRQRFPLGPQAVFDDRCYGDKQEEIFEFGHRRPQHSLSPAAQKVRLAGAQSIVLPGL